MIGLRLLARQKDTDRQGELGRNSNTAMPQGGLTKIDNTDWTDAQLRKDQRTYLCSIAKGIPSCCTAPAGREHSLFTPVCLNRREPQDGRGDAHELDVQGLNSCAEFLHVAVLDLP